MKLLRPFSVAFLLIIALSCSNKNRTTIQGKISNLPEEVSSSISELRSNTARVEDSVLVKKNGRFKYTLEPNKPGYYELKIGDKSLTLILMPGEKIDISADYNNFYSSKTITGSANSERLNQLHDTLRETMLQLNDIRDQYAQLVDSTLGNQAALDSLQTEFDKIKKQHHKFSVSFILEDIATLPNIGALYQEYAPNEYVFNTTRDLQYFKLVSDSLIKYYPNVRYVQTLRNNYDNFIGSYNTQRLLQNSKAITHTIPELELPAANGKNIALSSLKGKYVLLSFWSVDDEESIQNMLSMKKVYPQIKSLDFEIYQVAVGQSFERFKNRVYFEELDWIAVCDTNFPLSTTQGLYNVNTVPKNYLIDKEQQEIIARNIPADELQSTLSYLITQKKY